jgi:hypothetical protein
MIWSQNIMNLIHFARKSKKKILNKRVEGRQMIRPNTRAMKFTPTQQIIF